MSEFGRQALRDASIVIVGPKERFGVPYKLYEFLRDQAKVQRVTFIGHPFPRDPMRRSELLSSSRGHEMKAKTIYRARSLGVLSFAFDAFLTLFLLLLGRRRYDLYVATNPLLGLLGIFLETFGFVRKTVFWPPDYFPRRFRSEVLNRLALKADEMSATLSDYTWDVTPAITEARRLRGVLLRNDKVLVVPHVLKAEELDCPPSTQAESDTLIYVGLLSREYGFGLILESLPLVVKGRPAVRLTVTSYEPFPVELEERIARQNLEPYINFVGYVRDETQFTKLLQKHRIGLAPYQPDPFSWKNFVDASKAKTYMARGLPVIITRVPPIASEIEKEGAGIVISYDKIELSQAILRLLSDEGFYQKCRFNAFNLALRYREDRVFGDALRKMGFDL